MKIKLIIILLIIPFLGFSQKPKAIHQAEFNYYSTKIDGEFQGPIQSFVEMGDGIYEGIPYLVEIVDIGAGYLQIQCKFLKVQMNLMPDPYNWGDARIYTGISPGTKVEIYNDGRIMIWDGKNYMLFRNYEHLRQGESVGSIPHRSIKKSKTI